MADVEKKLVEKKDESAGLGTLLGFGAVAVLPFLRPFRNVGKIARALSTVTEKNAARTTVNEQLMPKLLPAPKEGITALTKSPKVQYQVVKKQPQIEPLVNDRDMLLKADAAKAFDYKDPQLKFGSALYDQIKMFPKEAASADDWIKFIGSKKNVKYPDGRSASIDLEELFDTNMAHFDKSGNLVGGLLKTAKDMNLTINKDLLLRQVKKNPFNELELKKFKTPSGIGRDVDDLNKGIEDVAKMLETKYLDETGTALAAPKIAQLRELVGNIRNQVNSQYNLNNINLSANSSEMKSILKNLSGQLSDPIDKRIVNNAIRTVNGVSESITSAVKGRSGVNVPVHATNSEYGTYRMLGEENPGEFVWKFKGKPDTINKDGVLDRSHNFGKYPIVHAMYGTRYTPQGAKVVSINEIQADIQQKVFDQVKGGATRVNKYGRETETGLLVSNLQPQRDLIDKIMKKGIYATDDELFQMHKAFNTLKSQSNVIRRGSSAVNEANQTAYLPFYNNKNYTDLALKTVIKEAADDGAQWVSVVPVEYISRSNGAVLGNQLTYGFSNGAGAFKKGEAVLPELMRKLAKQYKTEAKIIQVSKSNPNNPYKVVRSNEVSRYDGTQDRRGDVIEKYYNEHHAASFKTQKEAERFAERNGGKVEYIAAEDPANYVNMFALRISPDMLNKPMKLYKAEGGFIENVFKPL